MKKILFVFGTRPEAIKMAPLILYGKKLPQVAVESCVTGQHRQMVDQVLDFFNIKPEYDLNIMKANQTLFDVTENVLHELRIVLEKAKPDYVVVQGDTTTAFAGALAAFYLKIKVVHIEAGLRSYDKYSPFPEEINRKLVSPIAEYHFAPTKESARALALEAIKKNVYVVGNTVIDALLLGLDIIKQRGEQEYLKQYSFVDFSKKLILVTGHRRESFGSGFENICESLGELVQEHDDIEIVYPVHLNPNVREPVNRLLSGKPRIHLIEPVSYAHMIWLMSKSYLVLTDSGGVQEEAPSLGKPVLVMRDVTERMEGVNAGTARLVGTDKLKILTEVNRLLKDKAAYNKMAKATNPYGDGTSAEKIFGRLLA
jgi:UDP-N-acetylglucosamine 2-epimerase (non-hydrolysing)